MLLVLLKIFVFHLRAAGQILVVVFELPPEIQHSLILEHGQLGHFDYF